MSWKFRLRCLHCGNEMENFSIWFKAGQQCTDCDSPLAELDYNGNVNELSSKFEGDSENSLWKYFDYLPLNDSQHIVSFGEGAVPIDRWKFLEKYAQQYFGLGIKVYAQRNDMNMATGTFKDLAATVVASVFKENSIKEYVVASTGNTAVAYAKYLSAADINVYGFIPANSSKIQEAEIGCFGQKVYRVEGDYEDAKTLASQFADANGILLAAGNFDPMRVEAKKTMVFDWLRLLNEFPTVYIQALSGGTGPLGIAKALKDLSSAKLNIQMPRQILVQSDKCAPMARAWEKAKSQQFPDGWRYDYPIYTNPDTMIATLSTGNPKTYPVISKLVRESGGEIFATDENKTINVARFVALEASVLMGPAASIPVSGFLNALSKGYLQDGDIVLLNIGEGTRRSPEFMEKLIDTTEKVRSLNDCSGFDRRAYRDRLWNEIVELYQS